MVERVYHQRQGVDPVGYDLPEQWLVDSDDEPFKRMVTLGEQYKTLAELGCWLSSCSLLVIVNEEGRAPTVNPTEAERREMARHNVQVAIAKPEMRVDGQPPHVIASTVKPGRHVSLSPEDLMAVQLRCQCGSAKVTIRVFPE